MGATFEQNWNVLLRGFEKLFGYLEGSTLQELNEEDCELLQTASYNICTDTSTCTNDNCQKLYDKAIQVFKEYMDVLVFPSLSSKQDGDFLNDLVKRWDDNKILVNWYSHLFVYLKQHHIVRHSLQTFTDIGKYYRKQMYDCFSVKARDTLISMIEQERKGGELQTEDFIKQIQNLFVDFGKSTGNFYVNDYEEHVLADTRSYYAKAESLLEVDFWTDYVTKVEKCLAEEKDRASRYLLHSKENTLINVVVEQLLSKNICQKLLEEERCGCLSMLKNNKTEDLIRMCNLFFSIIPERLEIVSHLFSQHVACEGIALINQAKYQLDSGEEFQDLSDLQQQEFIKNVISLYEKCKLHVETTFSRHTLFDQAFVKEFKVICNISIAGYSFAKQLATFSDYILNMDNSKKLSDDFINKALDQVINLLKLIKYKDDFEESYRSKLGKRLLFGRSASDHERSMCSKMRMCCGLRFIAKMEKMMTDMQLAKENWSEFKEFQTNIAYAHLGIIELKVNVLDSFAWPPYKSVDLKLPVEVVRWLEVYKDFYETKNKNKKLVTWHHSLSVTVVGNFRKEPIELLVTASQAAVLMLFNSSYKLRYSEIQSQLNLSEDECVRCLHSLSCASYEILTKIPNTKEISRTDIFKFNAKFTASSRRIKVSLAPLKKAAKVVVKVVVESKQYAIDASIVWIMKKHKVLPDNQLLSECLERLHLTSKLYATYIKKRVADLIARDYMERDKDNPQILKYLPG